MTAHRPMARRSLRRMAMFCALSVPLLAAGCMFTDAAAREVEFSPLRHGLDYRHEFDEAFAAPSANGGYDLVMTSGFSPEEHRDGKTVHPSTVSRTRQLMHVQVAWRPASGSRSDFPAATNATIRYYVLTQVAPDQSSYISYSGAGFVAVDVHKHSSQFTIRDATVHPQEAAGVIRDPLGPSRVVGHIDAENNLPRVTQLLEELAQTVPAPTTAPSR